MKAHASKGEKIQEKRRQSRHEALREAALSAIEDLYCDTTVPQFEARDSLLSIIDDCKIKIEALELRKK